MFMGVAVVVFVLFVILVVRKELNEKRIINIVLSKLEFCPNHYKIIRRDNKIIIKCHYYSKEWSKLLFNNSSLNIINKNNEGIYICLNNIKLINYDPNKNLGIITYDILIDMKNRNYKIITSYFQIINCIRDDDNSYNRIINYLENTDYYINVNNIYDNNLDFINNYDEVLFEPFYYKFNQQKKHYLYNPNMKFNITITNGYDNFHINSMCFQRNLFPNFNIELSKDINSKPHINNSSFKINKISGTFI